MSAAVVIVSFNTHAELSACLRSVCGDPGAAEVVVADNGSSDGSIEMVRREYPGVRLLVDRSNPGYGAAANAGLRSTGAETVVVLNADTRVQPGAVAALDGYLAAHPRAAIVGPRLLNPDGTLQPSCRPFPTVARAVRRPGRGWPVRALPGPVRRRFLAGFPHDEPRVVPWVVGAALAIRRTAFEEVGGFDPSYFMFSEEVDLCYRLSRHGWETHFTPDAEVVHAGGCSTSQCQSRMTVQLFESAMRFLERHRSPRAARWANLFMTAGVMVRLGRDRLRYATAASPLRREQLAADLAAWRQLAGSRRPRGAGSRECLS